MTYIEFIKARRSGGVDYAYIPQQIFTKGLKMGLFDQVAGAITGATGTASEEGNSLLATVMQLVNNPQTGGLAGLVQSFQKGGLAEIANSWVSTGQNLPVSSAQIQTVLEGLELLKGKLFGYRLSLAAGT